MNIGRLKEIIKDMSDDAEVFARDRDCISLDMVHVVNHPSISNPPKTRKEINPEYYKKYPDKKKEREVVSNGNYPHPTLFARFVKNITDVYGGKGMCLENESKQAIIFCDCD